MQNWTASATAGLDTHYRFAGAIVAAPAMADSFNRFRGAGAKGTSADRAQVQLKGSGFGGRGLIGTQNCPVKQIAKMLLATVAIELPPRAIVEELLVRPR